MEYYILKKYLLMITELDIYNFQSWEEGHFVFHPGVNVIVGDSDMEKSAMLRSIRWVVWNRPSGTSVKSWWGGPTSVELVTPEGIVIRAKDKEDTYTLGIAGRKDMKFKAFGLSVPPEISELLDLSDVNFQKQIDQPFLLSQTPGERAIYFNRIAKLDKIDIGLFNINSWIRDLNSTIGSSATKDKSATGLIKQIEDTTESLTKFDHLEIYETEIEVLEIKGRNFISLCNRRDSLKNLVECIDEADDKIEKESGILIMEDDINQVIENIHDVRYRRNVRHDLSLKIQAIDWVDEQIEEKNILLGLEGQVVGLLVALNNRKNQIKLLTELTSLSRKIKILDAQIDGCSNTLIKDEEYFKKNFPDQCPLCGSKIEHEHEKN
jgi:exonuclease SbcC